MKDAVPIIKIYYKALVLRINMAFIRHSHFCLLYSTILTIFFHIQRISIELFFTVRKALTIRYVRMLYIPQKSYLKIFIGTS